MKPAVVTLMVLIVCACSSSGSPVAVSPSLAATASRVTYPGVPSLGRYAIMQRGTGGVDVVDIARVHVVTGTGVDRPSFLPNPYMPWTSASKTRVYLLSETGQIAFQTPDGATGTATTIMLAANQQAGFAVSPDDSRIAVSVFTYSDPSTYGGMVLYVEDLAAGGNQVVIFRSSSVAEYPIAWVGGNLVVAVSSPFCCQGAPGNPYAATSYHVVDHSSGRRLVTLCGTGAPWGPIATIGVMCRMAGQGPQFVRWDGTPFPAPAAVPDPGQYFAALSPDGTHVLIGGAPIQVWSRNPDVHLGINGYAIGWVDEAHVVVESADDNSFWLMDPTTGYGTQLPGETGYLGVLPTDIS